MNEKDRASIIAGLENIRRSLEDFQSEIQTVLSVCVGGKGVIPVEKISTGFYQLSVPMSSVPVPGAVVIRMTVGDDGRCRAILDQPEN